MKEEQLKEYICRYFSRENESVEWKEWKNLKNSFSGDEKEDLISYVSALSNMNGGDLVIGVQDKTLDIVGIQNLGNYTAENAKLKIAEQCTNLPTEMLAVDEYTTSDTGKTVWIVHIPKHAARQPVYAHKKAWMRIGDSLVEMTAERKERILHEVMLGEDWSAGIVQDATIEHLDPDAIEIARREFAKRNPKYAEEMMSWSTEKFLNKAKLTINGKITRTTLILLGREEAEALMSPAQIKIRWCLKTHDGENKDYDIFYMPFISAVDRIYNKVRNVKFRTVKDGTLFVDEWCRYDPFTIREPLYNCIAHSDYTMGARIEVVEFEDERLVFRNGGLFIPKSVQDVVERDCPQSIYRNPFLAEAMRNLNMIETQGGGIKKLFDLQAQRGFPMPRYEFDDLMVTLNIAGLPESGIVGSVNNTIGGVKPQNGIEKPQDGIVKGENDIVNARDGIANDIVKTNSGLTASEFARRFNIKFGKYEPIVLDAMYKNPSITIAQMEVLTGKSFRTVTRIIEKLRKCGIISRVGSDKKGHWQINIADAE